MPTRNIKVCHLSSVHQAYDVRIFLKECCSLAKAGFDVTFVVQGGKEEVKHGVQILGVPAAPSSRRKRMTSTVKQVLRKALEVDADIYHLHDPELLQIAIKLKQRGKKVIYDIHEDLPRQIKSKFYINPVLRGAVAWGIERFENRVARRLDHLFTATPAIHDRFVKINPKTTVINNFPLPAEMQTPAPWASKGDEVCYIGGITAIRGITQVVEALGQVGHPVQLNLAGGFTPDHYRTQLEALEGWGKVHALGFVSRETTGQVMARSKAGIVTFLPVPNHVDAQPNKMFEYMSAGIPVIASDFPVWRRIIEGYQCGVLVNPEDPAAIAKAIDHLLTNDAEAANMGRNGRKAVEEKFNWGIEEKRLVEVYEQLNIEHRTSNVE